MPDDRGTLRQIAWTELFPWFALVRALRLAVQARFLALATVAMVLTLGGWWVFGQMFSGTSNEQLQGWIAQYNELPQAFSSDTPRPAAPRAPWGPEREAPAPEQLTAPEDAVLAPWSSLTRPFRQFFSPHLSLAGLAFLILCGLWVELVWAFFGGVISRLAALQVARGERGSLGAAIRFVRGRYHAYFAAPLFPLFGVLLFALPLALLGLIGQVGAPGLTLLALAWPLLLVAGLVIAIFLVGLLFGWPLMWPTISTEGTDSFDALSRSYSYVYQRPLYYLLLVVVAGFLGTLGWLFVRFFVFLVLYTTAWGVSWGAGGTVLDPAALAEAAPLAARLIGFWSGVVQLVAVGFVYTFFFSAATISYFLLRQEVDGTESDEVFLEDQPDKFGLPPLATDEAGVPTVADEPTADELANNGVGEARP